jgi:hypothetical protein
MGLQAFFRSRGIERIRVTSSFLASCINLVWRAHYAAKGGRARRAFARCIWKVARTSVTLVKIFAFWLFGRRDGLDICMIMNVVHARHHAPLFTRLPPLGTLVDANVIEIESYASVRMR